MQEKEGTIVKKKRRKEQKTLNSAVWVWASLIKSCTQLNLVLDGPLNYNLTNVEEYFKNKKIVLIQLISFKSLW